MVNTLQPARSRRAAPTALKDVVTVPCGKRCGRDVQITRDDLRAAIDADRFPVCLECQHPPKPAKPTVRIAVLLAAAKLAAWDAGNAVGLSDLIVLLFEGDHERFGLPGYRERFPDSNRVNTEVCHMVRSRHLARAGERQLLVTQLGLLEARRLAPKESRP